MLLRENSDMFLNQRIYKNKKISNNKRKYQAETSTTVHSS